MSTATQIPIFDQMAVLGDPLRARLLALTGAAELQVAELCQILQLPQSTVSRHLKSLSDGGWCASRPDGPRRLYRSTVDALDDTAKELWKLARDGVDNSAVGATDRRRLESVLAQKQTASQEFFAKAGPTWDTLRDELFGDRFHLAALVGLVPSHTTVADLGCGTGRVAEAFAPFVKQVIGVDASEQMLGIARRRLDRFANVDLRIGALESLPIEDGVVDIVTLMLVLHHLTDPALAISEAARCMSDQGVLLIVDMLPHDREEYRQEMGHVWLGFSEDEVDGHLTEAGLVAERYVAVPPAAEARGPNLFSVIARKATKE